MFIFVQIHINLLDMQVGNPHQQLENYERSLQICYDIDSRVCCSYGSAKQPLHAEEMIQEPKGFSVNPTEILYQ